MFSLNTFVKPLKDKKDKTVLNAFIDYVVINYGLVKKEKLMEELMQ